MTYLRTKTNIYEVVGKFDTYFTVKSKRGGKIYRKYFNAPDFVDAYGPDSYDREKHELRYIYTLDDLKTELREHDLECVLHQKLKDDSYKKIFADCGFADSLYDSLSSTCDITVFNKRR